MKEEKVNINGDIIYVLISDIDEKKETVVLIHGLGESHVCFAEAFEMLPDFNIVVMDLPGYGNSEPSKSGDHKTATQAERVFKVLTKIKIRDFCLIGHSWGGDVRTLMCKQDKDMRVKKYINVEGDVHTGNVIMSEIVSEKFNKLPLGEFKQWLKGKGFAVEFPFKWKIAAGLRYFASVRICDPSVYGQTATEIYGMYKTIDENGVIEWGRDFQKLIIPHVYCWGSNSINDPGAIRFIRQIENHLFVGASHWLMMDSREEFYKFVNYFFNKQ
ncbi:MAG: alpha/beta fold hydrolase [Ignavibacteria bacterium]|jgi:pimeloyl-ACP methyl ester carboxylesterase